MKLTWYGTAALLIENDETRIAFDPFLGIPSGSLSRHSSGIRPHRLSESLTDISGNIKRSSEKSPGKSLRNVTAVCVTHGHFDHICFLPRLYGDTQIPIYATDAPCHTLRRDLRRRSRHHRISALFSGKRRTAKSPAEGAVIRRIRPGWQRTFGSLHVIALQSRHCRFDLPLILQTVFSGRFWEHPVHLAHLLSLNLRYPEKGETLFYEIRCGRVRLQILGSMNLDPNISYPTGADYLILPLQGRSDLDTYALSLVSRLRPKKIFLDHYDDSFPPMSGQVDPSGFIQNVNRQFAIPCIPLKKYKTIEL